MHSPFSLIPHSSHFLLLSLGMVILYLFFLAEINNILHALLKRTLRILLAIDANLRLLVAGINSRQALNADELAEDDLLGLGHGGIISFFFSPGQLPLTEFLPLLPLRTLDPPLEVTLGTLRAEEHLAAALLRDLVHVHIIGDLTGDWKSPAIFFFLISPLDFFWEV